MSHTFKSAQLFFSVVFVGRFHKLTFLYTIKNNASSNASLITNLLNKSVGKKKWK